VRKLPTKFIFLGLSIAIFSCSPVRYAKNLEYKEHAVQASFGGPIIGVPGIGSIPMPLTSLGYAYGVKEKTTLYGNWHTTAALFGVAQFDAGVTQNLWKNEKMGISISPSFNTAVDVFEKNFKFWPILEANYYWDYKTFTKNETNRTFYLYTGFSNWFELNGLRAHDLKQDDRILFNPHVGTVYDGKKWSYSLEMKFLAPYKSNENIILDYKSPLGNHGALGAYFSVRYRFKSLKK
jgi:hypothetical protein